MTNVARQLVPATSVDVIDACLSRDRWQLAQLNPSRGCVRSIAGVFQMKHSGGMSDITRILSQIESGDPSAADQLMPPV